MVSIIKRRDMQQNVNLTNLMKLILIKFTPGLLRPTLKIGW